MAHAVEEGHPVAIQVHVDDVEQGGLQAVYPLQGPRKVRTSMICGQQRKGGR